MKVYNFLGTYGDVGNVEACIETIKRAANVEDVDINYLNKYATNVNGAVRYLDEKLIELFDEHRETDAQYMWVDTGYKAGKYCLYASFYRTPLGWAGAYIGTEDRLREKLNRHSYRPTSLILNSDSKEDGEIENRRNYVTDEEYENLNKNKFCVELYKRLLIKEHWAKSKRGTNRLTKYLEAVTGKVQHNIKNNIVDGYILSNDGAKVLVNTGLIDEFMNDIYVCFEIADKKFVNPSIIENKIDIVRKGFDRERIKSMPKPVKFYNKPEELLFHASIEDFDIEDGRRLNHVINERRQRFPDKFSKMGADILGVKLKSAIEKAVRLSERDYKYVVPMYNTSEDCIQFLMPLHIERSIEEPPELVLVVAQIEGFFTVMTILNPDDAYDNARVIAKPGNSWLQPE